MITVIWLTEECYDSRLYITSAGRAAIYLGNFPNVLISGDFAGSVGVARALWARTPTPDIAGSKPIT